MGSQFLSVLFCSMQPGLFFYCIGSKRVDLRCTVGQWVSASWKMLPAYGPAVTRSSFGLRDLDHTFPEPSVVLSLGLYCEVSTDYQRLSFSSVSCSWLHMGCLALAMLIETQNLALPIALKHKYTHLQHVYKHTCMTL